MDKVTIPTACLRRIGSSTEDHKCIKLDSSEFVIGRAKDINYTIPDLLVSRRHAIIRFNKDHWSIESIGMNGVTLNHECLPKNKITPLNHMDIIELGAGSKYLYAFRIQSLEGHCEPNAKRKRLPLSSHNASNKGSPATLKSWMESKKSLERTLTQESDTIDIKLERQKILNNELINQKKKLEESTQLLKKELESKFANERKELEDKVARGELEKNELQREKELLERRMTSAIDEFQSECSRKTKELEESLSRAYAEKQKLLNEKEFIFQQLTREKEILQDKLEEESRLRVAVLDELIKVKESRERMEHQWEEERRRFTEEKRQFQTKVNDTRLPCSLTDKIECKPKAVEKRGELAKIESRTPSELEMLEAIQFIKPERNSFVDPTNLDMLDEGHNISAKAELDRVREELRSQMALKKQEIEQVSRQVRQDILGKIESVMENELQCGICSELMVFATSLNCMHTFCQYCINLWKKNKVECPICRVPITSEGRSLIVDNMIDAMVANMSEDLQTRRKELIVLRKELANKQREEEQSTRRIQTRQHAENASRTNFARRHRLEPATRPQAQRRTQSANQTVPAPPAPVRMPTHASGAMLPASSNDVRLRSNRASRSSIAVPQSNLGHRPSAQPNVPVSHQGRDPPRRRGRVSNEDRDTVVVLSSDSDSSVLSDNQTRPNDSVQIIDERLVQRPRRKRRKCCRNCGRSVPASSSCDICYQ